MVSYYFVLPSFLICIYLKNHFHQIMLVKYATSTYEIFKGVGTNLSKVTNEPKYFRFDPNDHVVHPKGG